MLLVVFLNTTSIQSVPYPHAQLIAVEKSKKEQDSRNFKDPQSRWIIIFPNISSKTLPSSFRDIHILYYTYFFYILYYIYIILYIYYIILYIIYYILYIIYYILYIIYYILYIILYSVHHLFVRLKSWSHRTIRVHSHCMKEHTISVPCCDEKMWETLPMLLSISWVSLLILIFFIFFVDVRAVPTFVLMRPEQ